MSLSVFRVPCPASMAHILDNKNRRDFEVVDFLQFGVDGMIKAVVSRKDTGECFLVSTAPADRTAFSERLRSSFRNFKVTPPPVHTSSAVHAPTPHPSMALCEAPYPTCLERA